MDIKLRAMGKKITTKSKYPPDDLFPDKTERLSAPLSPESTFKAIYSELVGFVERMKGG